MRIIHAQVYRCPFRDINALLLGSAFQAELPTRLFKIRNGLDPEITAIIDYFAFNIAVPGTLESKDRVHTVPLAHRLQ